MILMRVPPHYRMCRDTAMPPKPSKVLTRADVKAQTNDKKVLLVIKDNIYDVTDFLDEHPGGRETVMDVAGGDGTSEFEAVGHSKAAIEMMAKYLVGTVPEEEKGTGVSGGGSSSGGSPVVMLLVIVVIGAIIAFYVTQMK